jgi:hypothetical protein
MLSEKEAEDLAGKLVAEYITACDCKSRQDVANVLMKLCSLAGLVMAAGVGAGDAAGRLEATAQYVAQRGKYARFEEVVKH